MLRIEMSLEDVILTATRADEWTVFVRDIITSKHHHFTCTDAELVAIASLAIGGDDVPVDLYAVAEKVLVGCPHECRPIP